jgi:protein SCO1/2
MKSLIITWFLLAGSAAAHSTKGKVFTKAMSVVPGGGVSLVDFTLQNVEGKPLSYPSVAKGHWSMVYFGFTTCTDACPSAASYIRSELKELNKSDLKLPLYFISVDPKVDTGPKVKTWLGNFDPSWIGLMGNDETLKIAAKQFGAAIEKPLPGDQSTEKILHSSILFLVSPDGKWVQYLPLPAKKGVLAKAVSSLKAG